MRQSDHEYEERSFGDIQRAIDFDNSMNDLESQLYYRRLSPKEVAQQVLKATCQFYDADWCGLIQVAEKFFTYTKLGFPCPRRFRSIRPNSSSSRSNFVALLSAQHNALLTSSIVKMINTRFCLSSQPFFTDRLMRSSRIPYRVLASVDRLWNRCS